MLSVGSVHDYCFVAYGSGCNLVILDSNLERIQTIPGTTEASINAIACTTEGGQIAVSYGLTVAFFAPSKSFIRLKSSTGKVSYEWDLVEKFFTDSPTKAISWSPDESKIILACGRQIKLYREVTINEQQSEQTSIFFVADRCDINERSASTRWKCIFTKRLPSSIAFVVYSSTGRFFATSGVSDCIVRVWYNHGNVFRAIFLPHSHPVTFISWRRNSKFLSKTAISDCLLTQETNGVCRLWRSADLSILTDSRDHIDQEKEIAGFNLHRKTKHGLKGNHMLKKLLKSKHNRTEDEIYHYRQLLSHYSHYGTKRKKVNLHETFFNRLRRLSSLLHVDKRHSDVPEHLSDRNSYLSNDHSSSIGREDSRLSMPHYFMPFNSRTV
ncbi:hypothetical protein ACOME3_009105 [Neoechinorhynchus agilis]